MVQPRLAGCAKAALRHSRGFGSSSQNYAPTPLSVAKLLASQPTDPDSVVVNGFVRSLRNQKKRSFAAIGDGSSLEPLQALLTPDQAESLSTGAAVRLTGRWLPSPAQGQSHELHVADVDVLGSSDAATFPLQKKYQSPEFLRTIPHIRPRTPFNSAMLRLRSQSIAQLTQFFAEKDFTQTHPPIITSSDCEGAGETFVVTTREEKQKKATEGDDGSFFRSPKYLTVSSQLHLEALAQSVGNVWTLSPTFRAEKSDTARHLSEFYMLEAEMTFVESIDDLMVLIEQMLQSLTIGLYSRRVVQEIIHGKRATETGNLEKDVALAEELEQRWQGMMSGSWPRITYTEAISQLQKNGLEFEHEPVWGSGLQAEHERYIASSVGQGKPVFVTAYPKSIKPFYMLPSNSADSGETVECFDLLVPEVCEIIGGSMREYRADQLIDSMRAHGMLSGEQQGLSLEESMGSLKWYVDLRKWGTVPHGGFGLGFDRLLGYLSGVPNIREVVTFPRWVGRCEC